MDRDVWQDKIRGSIVCGACGDALGYTIEFESPYKQIEEIYGEGGLREYDLRYPWTGQKICEALVSDDTQMTLYTVEGLLEAVATQQDIMPLIRDAYLVWFAGQTGYAVNVCYESELGKIPELNQRRAPGNTCLSALHTISTGSWPDNSSKGCGGIMRVAPVGLYGAAHGWTLPEIARVAGDAAELTHLHPFSTYSSAVFAVIVGQCSSTKYIDIDSFRQIINESLLTVADLYGVDAEYMKEFVESVNRAVGYASDPRPDWEVIEESLGGGWVAEETLAIALFSVLRHFDDISGCLISAVNHGGDSDSTGAVAGNIIGAIWGYGAIPLDFTEKLQMKDLLLSISDRLCE